MNACKSQCVHKVLHKVVFTNVFSLATTGTYVVSVSIGSDLLSCIFCESSYVTDAKPAGKDGLDPCRWTGIYEDIAV